MSEKQSVMNMMCTTAYNEVVHIMFITDCFSDMIFFYFMFTHEQKRENFWILKNFVSWMRKRYDLKINMIWSDNEMTWKETLCWLWTEAIDFESSVSEISIFVIKVFIFAMSCGDRDSDFSSKKICSSNRTSLVNMILSLWEIQILKIFVKSYPTR